MTTRALQRAIVRMSYDPTLVARVHADAPGALADADLDAAERALLLAWDPRAFGADSQRRTRTLGALLEEYPATCVVVATHARSAAGLDAFFASSHFHTCIQHGGPLALAFGEYLAGMERGSPTRPAVTTSLAQLELAIARSRRAATPDSTGRHDGAPAEAAGWKHDTPMQLRLAPGLAVVELPLGTLAVQQAVAGALGASLVAQPGSVADAVIGLATVGLSLPALAPTGSEHLLIHAQATPGSPVSIERTPAELARVLAAAALGVSRAALLAIVRAEGAAPGEDESVLTSLVADGLLVRDGRERVSLG